MKKLIIIAAAVLLSACTGKTLNSKEYGTDWPFTVNEVTIGCDAMGLPYVDAGRSGTYGLTGHAVSKGYSSVAKIHIVGVSLSPFIDMALDECR